MAEPNSSALIEDLESMLFGWDPGASTRQADAFVRGLFRPQANRTRRDTGSLLRSTGAYACSGGETLIMRPCEPPPLRPRPARAA